MKFHHVVAVTLTALLGCTAKKPPPNEAIGLAATTNDARVVTLARAALECSWTDDHGIDEKCPALGAWKSAGEVRASTADVTLLELGRDERPAVRWLAAVALAGTEEAESTRDLTRNPVHAKALVEAARRETHVRVARELGFAVAEIHGGPTQLEISLRELATHHALPLLRLTLLSRVLRHNPDAFGWVAALARTERDSDLRGAAVGGLRFAPSERFDATAKLWLETVSDKDAEVAEKAASCCAYYEAICAPEWNPLLDAMQTRGGMPGALWNLFSRPKATPAQKARALKLARVALDDTKLDELDRSMALLIVADMDPALGVTLAAKYANDPSMAMMASVEIVMKEHGPDAGADAAPPK